MKLNLAIIILFVQNVANVKNFYVRVLGLKVIEEIQSEWVLLKAGDCKIGLHKSSGELRGSHPTGCETNTKIVFETTEDIHKMRKFLLDQKIQMKEVKSFDNYPYWLCDGQDPEGNVFQIKSKM